MRAFKNAVSAFGLPHLFGKDGQKISGHEPLGFDKKRDGLFLIEITSKEQFDELFKEDGLHYSPPDDKE